VPVRVKRFTGEYISKAEKAKKLIEMSFIEPSLKSIYFTMIDERIEALRYSCKA
jgi:hypothetical protein